MYARFEDFITFLYVVKNVQVFEMYQSPSFLLRGIKDHFFLKMLLIISEMFLPYIPNEHFERRGSVFT